MNGIRRNGPQLVINPANDRELARQARALTVGGALTPATLQVALRPQYPGLVVHRRELSGEAFETWYVYREGRWISSGSEGGEAPVPPGTSGGRPA